MTSQQKRVMADLDAAKGQVHYRYTRGKSYGPDYVHERTIRALVDRGLVRYRMSSGYVSVSTSDREPEEPREHILKPWLAAVEEALIALGGRAKDQWALHECVRRGNVVPSGLTYGAMQDALGYGVRKGRIKLGACWKDPHHTSRDWSVEFVG